MGRSKGRAKKIHVTIDGEKCNLCKDCLMVCPGVLQSEDDFCVDGECLAQFGRQKIVRDWDFYFRCVTICGRSNLFLCQKICSRDAVIVSKL